AHRPHCEATLRHQEALPQEAVTMAVALDGVMAPMHDGQRQATRPHALANGQTPSGPGGRQEVGCATVSSDDRQGERLLIRRMARMPEGQKATLTSPLTAEVGGALRQRPEVRGVTVADGAPDTWRSLGETLPCGEEVRACSHAAAHLSAALGAAYGEGTPPSQARVATLREIRRDAPAGADTVMGALCRLRTRSPRRQAMQKALASFREHRHRRRSRALRAQHLPIGTGVVEAAGTALVSQRLKG